MCIDPVVLPVRADEPNIDDAIRIIDPHHNAILVAGDVEHRATAAESARAADGSLQVRWRRPIGSPSPAGTMPSMVRARRRARGFG